jgi:hypothetical protein
MVATLATCPDLHLCGVHTALRVVMQIASRPGNEMSLRHVQKAPRLPGAMVLVQPMEANL